MTEQRCQEVSGPTLSDLAEAWSIEFDEMLRQYPDTHHVDAAHWAIEPAFHRVGEHSLEAHDWLEAYIAERVNGFMP